MGAEVFVAGVRGRPRGAPATRRKPGHGGVDERPRPMAAGRGPVHLAARMTKRRAITDKEQS